MNQHKMQLALVAVLSVLNVAPCASILRRRGAQTSLGFELTGSPMQNHEGVFRIRHEPTGRYLAVHESVADGRCCVVIAEEPLDPHLNAPDITHQWVITRDAGDTYSVMHYTTGRFLEGEDLHGGVVHAGPAHKLTLNQSWFMHTGSMESDSVSNLVLATTGQILDIVSSEVSNFTLSMMDPEVGQHPMWVFERVGNLPVPLFDGIFTLRQKSSELLLAADNDVSNQTHCYIQSPNFTLSQHFIFRRVKGEVYTITQQPTGRELGAEPLPNEDGLNYSVVLRPFHLHEHDSQNWLLVRLHFDEFVFVHVPTGRVLDAWEPGLMQEKPHAFTTNASLHGMLGDIHSQVWTLEQIGTLPNLEGIYALQSKETELFMDTDDVGSVVATSGSRKQVTESQAWRLQRVPGSELYAISADSDPDVAALSLPGDCLDAAPNAPVRLVDSCEDASQLWYATYLGDMDFELQTQESGDFLGVSIGNESVHNALVTTATPKTWILHYMAPICIQRMVCPSIFECGVVQDGCSGQSDCGQCAKRNAITGEPFDCVEHSCRCSPRTRCDDGVVSGVQEDGCGGLVSCSPPEPEPGAQNASTPAATSTTSTTTTAPTTTPCTPNITCPGSAECGIVDDGCGRELICGDNEGQCTGNLTCTDDNLCRCLPLPCDDRCGEFPNGCGGMMRCGCEAADTLCDEEHGVCIHIQQPPPPSDIFEDPPEPDENVTVEGNSSANGTVVDASFNVSVAGSGNASATGSGNASMAGSGNASMAGSGNASSEGSGNATGGSAASNASAAANGTSGENVSTAGTAGVGTTNETVTKDTTTNVTATNGTATAESLDDKLAKLYLFYYNYYYFYHRRLKLPGGEPRSRLLAEAWAKEQVRRMFSPIVPAHEAEAHVRKVGDDVTKAIDER